MARLIFFGNERLANAVEETGVILQSLLDAGHEVTHLIINKHDRVSRNKKQDKVVEIAQANEIEVIDHWDEQQIIELAKQSDAGVLASFGKIIKNDVIEAFPHGIINIHPSLLPRYRGTTPIESTIMSDDAVAGVSVMALAAKMDAGNVYAAAEHEIRGNETKQELYEVLAQKGAGLLAEHLPEILSGKNKGTPQDDENATFTKMIIKSDGLIDWDQPAEAIEKRVRAFTGWPGSKAEIAGYDLILTQVTVSDVSGTPGEYEIVDKQIVVACGSGSIVVQKLKPAGKGEMTAEAFLAGHQL